MREQSIANPNAGELVSVEQARALVGNPREPCARQTIFVLGATGEIAIQKVAGRYLVRTDSIASYKNRKNVGELVARAS